MSVRIESHAASALPASEEESFDAPHKEAERQSFGRRALDTLYRSQAGRLLRFFNRRSNPQDAADLLQETFTRFAHATLERQANPDCPESYLTKVAVNVVRERGRSPAQRAASSAVALDDAVLIGPDELAALEARDMLDRVDAVMMMLKPLTRDIFIARRFHGLSRAEIASQTGLSVKAVDKQLGRAVEHLHRHLGEQDES